MASEAVGPDPSATARRDAATIVAAPPLTTLPSSIADAGMAIGYEAADPALQAPLWTEAMQSASRSLR